MSRVAIVSFCLMALAGASTSCMNAYKRSVGADERQVYRKIFLTDYETTWQSVLEALKSFRLDVSNKESGFVQTRWIDNTTSKNFIDTFGGTQRYHKAQFRFRVTTSRGLYNGKRSVKISVQKEQMVTSDVLEGWREVHTDGIEENTLLYRIGRIIRMKLRLAKADEQEAQDALKDVDFDVPDEGEAP